MTTQNMVNNISDGFKRVLVSSFAIGARTYTPTYGMIACQVAVIGGGASGGGSQTTSTSNVAAGSGGGSGAIVVAYFTAAQIGVSQSLFVGSGGAGATAGNNPGNSGTASTFGSSPILITANPGQAGAAGILTTSVGFAFTLGGIGGTFSVDASVLNFWGNNGSSGGPSMVGIFGVAANQAFSIGGYGAGNGIITPGTIFAGGGNSPGFTSKGPGSGSAGATAVQSVVSEGTGAGANGAVFITEYLK